MNKYFRYSIGLMFVYSLLATLIKISGLGLNSGHFRLIFITLSYAMLFIGLIRYKVIRSGTYLEFDKFMIGILIVWFLICIFRSIQIPLSNISTFPRFLGGTLYTPAFLVPFFVYLGGNFSIINMVWKFAKKFYVVFLILSPLLFTSYAIDLLMLIGFLPILYLNQDKLTKSEMLFLNMSFIICIVFFVLDGSRNIFVGFVYYYIIASIIWNKNKFKHIMNFNIIGIVLLLLFAAGFIYLYTGNLSEHFLDKRIKGSIEEFEKDNFNSDSHRLVIEDFIIDFSNWEDLLLGRGVLGTTFSPQFIPIQESSNTTENVFRLPAGHRLEIESGYLQIILKSGLIGLILFIIIGFRAIFLGFFRTKNTFTKICAIIVTQRYLVMISGGLPEYALEYILYWLCVGACLSPEIRNISNVLFFLNFKYFKHRDLLIHKLSEDKYKLT